MMMMMSRVMCVLAVVLCCACGYTMAAAAATTTNGGQPKAEMAFFTDVIATEARIVGFIPVGDDNRQSSNLAKPGETNIVAQHTSGQGNDSLGRQEIPGGFGFESVKGSRLTSVDSGEEGRENQLRENEVVLPGPEAKVKDVGRTGEPVDQTQQEQNQQLGGTGGTMAGQSEQRTVELARGQDGVSESAHQSNAISHASGTAASDSNLPGVGTNSGHSPAAAVSPAPALVPAERTEAEAAGDNQAGSSGSSATNAEGEANQTTPAASTTENNNSVNRDSNSVNSPNNKESTTTTATTTTTFPSATAVSEGNDDASAATTTNINTEAPTTTLSSVPVPNAEISNSIASTVQNKANADSSVSSVWMRTAAPLLIVAVLFSATVY
ncbi:uncharacterized protein TM35_000551430 [Trypanosoma theileri]|uniref:Mucin TcMUCII n=1 Tax=Trypanosoma theileri TaxID=67003 RepID=A0A1X0NGH3_9TRYP|nr:uncharacterized protein TM35_001501040 [Trypanosoma theileri]XP_028877940.1 uncharacterized protein TM35_000551430 [Trypanosoma theileri]ORC80674.1 hypothetical protein TM35_001501040 [Trypanosoma theileri]ORC83874.1 hypothetical protein TM35_000551430 [Trypanosoma theileri]